MEGAKVKEILQDAGSVAADNIASHVKVRASDSITLALLLALNYGVTASYSYICRGNVFANVQAGNIVLMGMRVANGDFGGALLYFLPMITYILGVICSDLIRNRAIVKGYKIHWRELTVAFNALVLLAVAFMPESANLLANSLAAMAGGAQAEAFMKVRALGENKVVPTGNLQSATHAMAEYLLTGSKHALHKSESMYAVILFTFLGATLGAFLSRFFGLESSIFCSVILIISLLIMHRDKD